jgi:hypothetical protein
MPVKRVIIGCPKFDDARVYAQKLTEILKENNIASITVAYNMRRAFNILGVGTLMGLMKA